MFKLLEHDKIALVRLLDISDFKPRQNLKTENRKMIWRLIPRTLSWRSKDSDTFKSVARQFIFQIILGTIWQSVAFRHI